MYILSANDYSGYWLILGSETDGSFSPIWERDELDASHFDSFFYICILNIFEDLVLWGSNRDL